MNNGNGTTAEDGWGGDDHRPRENARSRSRSPGRGRDSGSSRPEVGANPGNNLHVSGLGHKIDNRDLEAAFGKFGRVQKAAVMFDPHTRESRGFGFVTMESAEEADAAIAGLNATEINGKTINVEKV
ncbi:RNA-binding domain-containing protein [Ramaria rubella]|nr:RNA-binding domain-containing protein [Ramaria rubella]